MPSEGENLVYFGIRVFLANERRPNDVVRVCVISQLGRTDRYAVFVRADLRSMENFIRVRGTKVLSLENVTELSCGHASMLRQTIDRMCLSR